MKRHRRLIIVVALLALAGMTAAAALGYAAGRVVQLQRGDRADFSPASGHWSCFDTGKAVSCGSGDARPSVDLTVSTRGVTVVVHTLKDPQDGRLVRGVDRYGSPVYTFSARR